ncbi:MAG: peptidoglycan endopeptidase [Ignavibacteriae bacterium]|nr:peptidoglycan endopeptidase [Ignavibacteriota bacterium]
MKKLLIILILLPLLSKAYSQTYALAIDYTPVLNTYDQFLIFGGTDGSIVKLDKRGLIGEMEFIAFPGTVFNILEIVDFQDRGLIYYRVKTDDYQYNGNFYLDSRFVNTYDEKPNSRIVERPNQSDVVKFMKSLIGYPYMWGGNYADGIYTMLSYYQPKAEIDTKTKNLWILKGVDCSGLLYQSTAGYTPRNTSSLLNYGEAVNIEDKSIDEIIPLLKPLDLIVIKGHVVIVLDDNTTIESSPDKGVHTNGLKVRLSKIMEDYKPVNEFGKRAWRNKEFVLRRWI